MSNQTFKQILSDAIKDMLLHGYDSALRVQRWTDKLRYALESETANPTEINQRIIKEFTGKFDSTLKKAPRPSDGLTRSKIDRIRPELRGELDRRIKASADLIKLNRFQMIDRTEQRFQGWATSIPKGGTDLYGMQKAKAGIIKPLKQLSFEERRVMIDQGHKMAANINATIAEGSGAIAAIWRSRYRQEGYNYRPDHKDRDGKVYAIRNNWAMEEGLMKVGSAGYTDEIEMVAELPLCRCSYSYIYSLRKLPPEMLTQKGQSML